MLSLASFLSASLVLFASAQAQNLAGLQMKVYAWPVASSNSQEIARIGCNTDINHCLVKKFDPPRASDPDALVRVGFYDKETSEWRGVVTAASSFSKKFQQKIDLHLDDRSQVWHIGFSARPKPKLKKGQAKAEVPQVVVELVRTTPGPTPHLNKPVVLDAEGKVQDKEEEKTFLQKYWWAIGLVLLVQLLVAGGGGDK